MVIWLWALIFTHEVNSFIPTSFQQLSTMIQDTSEKNSLVYAMDKSQNLVGEARKLVERNFQICWKQWKGRWKTFFSDSHPHSRDT